ncbi:MAG: type III PLP-dependent enzyme [Desulfobacter sp.]
MLSVEDIKMLARIYGTPVLFLNTEEVVKAYNHLSEALPGVKIFYALKSNNHEAIVKQLGDLGAGFDLCSNSEVALVLKHGIPMGRCIHTHPVKKKEEIEYAYDKGVRVFVVDNKNELIKLKKYAADLKLFIRLAVRNPNSLADLSRKFGIYSAEEATWLISEAHKMGFKEFGLCFHCGSQCENPKVYLNGIAMSKKIISRLERMDINISTIDIGGGFPVGYNMENDDLSSYCKVFYPHLKALMQNGIEVLCEPGRYLSARSMFLITKVIGINERKEKIWYYIDDGVYNSFSGQIYDHVEYSLSLSTASSRQKIDAVLAGPTCDSFDVVNEKMRVAKHRIGDLMVFNNMGAYTSVSASSFNGYPRTKVITLSRDWHADNDLFNIQVPISVGGGVPASKAREESQCQP